MSLSICKHLSDLHVPDFKIIRSPHNSLCCVGKAWRRLWGLSSPWKVFDHVSFLRKTIRREHSGLRLIFGSSEFCISIFAAKPVRFILMHRSQGICTARQMLHFSFFSFKKELSVKTFERRHGLLTKTEAHGSTVKHRLGHVPQSSWTQQAECSYSLSSISPFPLLPSMGSHQPLYFYYFVYFSQIYLR